MDRQKNLQLVIVTGLSGAGKTVAIQSFEDQGYFCVDNLPPSFIPKFAELCAQSEGKIQQVALVIDIRGGEFFDSLFAALEQLDDQQYAYEILFLEASDDTLVRRFKESRRRHPLGGDGGILEGIWEERKRLEKLKFRATIIIDTSGLSSGELKQELRKRFGVKEKDQPMNISIISFGYKYGIPIDVDLLMDVRFLPNPFYQEDLRLLTGTSVEVQDYVFESDAAKEFLAKYAELILLLLPQYVKEGKSQLVIGIGCTGGQHRSVTLACKLGEKLATNGYEATVKHRDAAKNVALLGRKD
ncbi:MAG: RNase adapter RapZ [Clostridia bacterium]|nr:RNase adapter RapZ [Clostridia bacterium]